MRIISLLPQATEILYLLNSVDQIVGVSEECDFPKEIKNKPVVSFCLITQSKSSKFIDKKVSSSLSKNLPINQIDEELFISLKPDLIITQELCKVCALTPTNIQKTILKIKPTPQVLALHPHSIKEILADIVAVGEKIGKLNLARKKVVELKSRIKSIKNITHELTTKPKVYCMEWLDPPYNGGHWVPEQVELAGGRDELAIKRSDSSRLLWENIVKYDPEFIFLMPCGFSIQRTKKELAVLYKNPFWKKLNAVKNNRIYAVNGPAYFNCSGPRVVEGIELIAQLLHPRQFDFDFDRKSYQKISYY